MLRCPNCRVQNPGTSCCRRCGMELVALQNIETKAKNLVLCALTLLLQENPRNLDYARHFLLQACKLQQDSLSTILLEFINTRLAVVTTELS